MKNVFKTLNVCLIFLFSFNSYTAEMLATVNLSPTGSFEVKTKRIRGGIQKIADGYEATNIEISVKSFETGVDLRDEHLKKKLEMDAFPNIIVEKASGQSGSGTAMIKVRNSSQKVPFTYKEKDSGKSVTVNFTMDLKSFGLTGMSYMGVGVENDVKIEATLPVK